MTNRKLLQALWKIWSTIFQNFSQTSISYFLFSQRCAISHSLLPEWATSKKPSAVWQGFPPNMDPLILCQAICTICWVWVSGRMKVGQLELSTLKCHILGKYQNSLQKAPKQSPLLIPEEDWLNMVAFLKKVFSFQTLKSPPTFFYPS